MRDVGHTRGDIRRPCGARREVEARIRALVANQHGVIGRWQLVHLGLGAYAIRHRLRTGRLVRVYPGVYAVGHAQLGELGRLMAAVLAGGPGALLSHQSAADLSEILRTSSALIHVTTPNRRRRRLENIVFHRARELHPRDRTLKHGIPLTAWPRTLLDLAECVPPNRLRQAIEQAERVGLFDLRAISELIERSPGRRGLKPLTALLAQLEDAGPPPDLRSANEQRFRDLCLEYGVPPPSFNVVVCGHLVDAFWPRQRLVVEIDAYGTHSDRETFESDRQRDVDLQLAGIGVLRFTDQRLGGDPATVAATVIRALSLRAR